MEFVTSADGTEIAFDRHGEGPRLILVGGGLDDGSENAALAAELADTFTVINFQRRGRGSSGDHQPYAVEREIEDVRALVEDGPVHLFGVSSGGALALEVVAAGVPIDRVAVYEVPYLIHEGLRAAWLSYVDDLHAALAEDRRDDALKLFMRLAGSPEERIAEAEASEQWPRMLRIAHTLAYDAACLRDGHPPRAFEAISRPVLLAIGTSEWMGDFYPSAAEAVQALVPQARRKTLKGQGHVADPKMLAAVLRQFFLS